MTEIAQITLIALIWLIDFIDVVDLQQVALAPPRAVNGTGPVVIYAGFYLESIANFQESTMSYTTDMYLRLSWHDARLTHRDKQERIIDDRASQWMPDVYFQNAIDAQFQHVTRPNFALMVYPNGTVAYSTRIYITLSCHMVLIRYPHDGQWCRIQMSLSITPPRITLTDRFTSEQVQLRWFDEKSRRVQVNPAIEISQYYIDKIDTFDCTSEYQYGSTATGYQKGNFSCLVGVIYLRRELMYHLIQTYVPPGLMVVISWVSFFIDSSAVPARITLSFTTLLTLTTQLSGVRNVLPPVSYIKAVDVWFFTCQVFVFAGLIEFALVNSLAQKALRFGTIARGQSSPPIKSMHTPKPLIWFLRLTGGRPEVLVDAMSELQKSAVTAMGINMELAAAPSSGTTNGSGTSNGGGPLARKNAAQIGIEDRSKTKNAVTSELRTHYAALQRDYQTASDRVDWLSRFMFPISFALFLTGYYFAYAVSVTYGELPSNFRDV